MVPERMKAKRAGYSKQTRHPLRPTVDRRQRLVDPQLPQLLAQAGDFGVAAEAMADRIAVCVRGRPAPKLKLDAAADLDALAGAAALHDGAHRAVDGSIGIWAANRVDHHRDLE